MLLKIYKKQVHLFKWGYMINGNENETEIKKTYHQDTTQIDLDLDMDTNKLYVKCVSL